MYGSPASVPLCRGICGREESHCVSELTRLWVDDSVPKNGESFLVGNTISRVPKEIIVSFADSSVGHLGTIYQATNFIYTGLSDKHTEWRLKDKSLHSRSLWRELTLGELKEKYGDLLFLAERPRKHRYIYFNTKSRKRKRELLSKLRYTVLPYPKETT